MMRSNSLVVMAALLLISACAIDGNLNYIHDLQDSDLPADQVVSLETINLLVTKINEREINGRVFNLNPGVYRLTVWANGSDHNPIHGITRTISSTSSQDVVLDMKAGCRYSLQLSVDAVNKTWSTKVYGYFNRDRGIGIPLLTSDEERKKIREERSKRAKTEVNTCEVASADISGSKSLDK